MRTLCLPVAIAFPLALLLSARAAAFVPVFVSERDDAIESGTQRIAGPTLVHVWFDAGSTAGTPGQACTPASGGSHVCQWAVQFQTTGDLVISDVAWSGIPIAPVEDDEPTSPATTRAGTGGDAVTGQLGRHKIATVSLSGTRGELNLYTPPGFGFVDPNGVAQLAQTSGPLAAAAPMPWRDISASPETTCGVLGNGELRCWGPTNVSAPAGTYTEVDALEDGACALNTEDQIDCFGGGITDPPPVLGTTFVQLASGTGHMCGLLPDLEVGCWGDDSSPGSVEQAPKPPGPFQLVSRGNEHACALRLDGSVACWGSNTSGQSTPPLDLRFKDLAGGGNHTCGIAGDGPVVCWGSNNFGQSTPPLESGNPITDFVEISAGDRHTCGIREGGPLVCWGDNSSGQSAPMGSFEFALVSLADDFGCGLHEDGQLHCWPPGGSGTPDLAPYPQLAAGDAHTCEIRGDNTLECWPPSAWPGGSWIHLASGNGFGCAVETGTGDTTCWGSDDNGKASPIGGPFTQVATGQEHACGLKVNGRVSCWGLDTDDQASPPPFVSFERIAAGTTHSCGIRTDGSVLCWGSDGLGQSSPPPGTFRDVGTGTFHSCGIRTNGSLACWGTNIFGQSTPPAGSFTSLAVADYHNCAVRTDGDLACWGKNTDGESNPASGKFVSVTANGASHSCAVAQSGGIACWGAGGAGQTTPPFDFDGDGFEDGADNCPNLINPMQIDSDGDGIGDGCDNCVDVPNPAQFNQDGDLFGDLCDEEAILTVTRLESGGGFLIGGGGGGFSALASREFSTSSDGGAGTLAAGDAEYMVGLTCGSVAIKSVAMGAIMPPSIDPTTVQIGANSTSDPGCLFDLDPDCSTPGGQNLSGVFPAVNGAASKVVAANTAGFPNTFYFNVVGSGTDGRLCNPGQSVDLFKIVSTAQEVPDADRVLVTQEGLVAVANIDPTFPTDPFTDVAGIALDVDEYVWSVGAENATVRLILKPVIGDPTLFDVSLSAKTEIKDLTFGFVLPEDTTQAEVLGCPNNTSVPVLPIGTCSPAPVGSLTTQANAALSWTVRPPVDPQDPADLDTLYFRVFGALNSSSFIGQKTINVAHIAVKLATIKVVDPTPGDPVVLTIAGVSGIAPTGNPLVRPNNTTLDPTDQNLALTEAGGLLRDLDSDGIVDESDLCIYAWDPSNADNGGAPPDDPFDEDGVGDVCQCGEAHGPTVQPGVLGGVVDGTDVVLLLQALTGENPDAGVAPRGSVSGNDGFDIKDVVVVKLATDGTSTPDSQIDQLCERAISSFTGDNQ